MARTRGDGGCGIGPLARGQLAPCRRSITFGRQRDSELDVAPRTKAIAPWEGTIRLWISIQALHINARTGQLGAQITVKTGQAARITATATAVGRDSHRRVVHLVVHRLNSSRHEIAVGYPGARWLDSHRESGELWLRRRALQVPEAPVGDHRNTRARSRAPGRCHSPAVLPGFPWIARILRRRLPATTRPSTLRCMAGEGTTVIDLGTGEETVRLRIRVGVRHRSISIHRCSARPALALPPTLAGLGAGVRQPAFRGVPGSASAPARDRGSAGERSSASAPRNSPRLREPSQVEGSARHPPHARQTPIRDRLLGVGGAATCRQKDHRLPSSGRDGPRGGRGESGNRAENGAGADTGAQPCGQVPRRLHREPHPRVPVAGHGHDGVDEAVRPLPRGHGSVADSIAAITRVPDPFGVGAGVGGPRSVAGSIAGIDVCASAGVTKSVFGRHREQVHNG